MSRIGRLLIVATLSALMALPAHAAYRIKDIADFEGIRDNMLVGYGLVVGLNGTGDSLRNSPFTKQSLEAMLERMGINIRDNNAKTDNVAAVMVTASLPAFSRQGSRIDVNVSAIGDAKNLQGGTLLVSPLMGADGEVYAVAQGAIAIGGFKAAGAGASIVRGVPTAGKIANGAIVEREVGFELASLQTVRIALKNPDLTTARRIGWAINRYLGLGAARTTDAGTVTLVVPESLQASVVDLIAEIEQLTVEPDQPARVVIDENNGIIVIGNEVRISTVAVAQGSLTVKITETPQVSQPNAFAPGPGILPGIPGIQGTPQASGLVPVPRLDAQGRQVLDATGAPVFDQVPAAIPGTGQPAIGATPGQIGGGASTVVVPRTDIQVDDQSDKRLGIIKSGVSLGELVNGLNSLGIGPRDMISILQAVKAAGALQADIVTR